MGLGCRDEEDEYVMHFSGGPLDGTTKKSSLVWHIFYDRHTKSHYKLTDVRSCSLREPGKLFYIYEEVPE